MNEKDILLHEQRQYELARESEVERLAQVASLRQDQNARLGQALASSIGRVLIASGEYLVELGDAGSAARHTPKTS